MLWEVSQTQAERVSMSAVWVTSGSMDDSMSGATEAAMLLLLLSHGKEGSYDRNDLEEKELPNSFLEISVGFVQGPLCYYQPVPFTPIQRLIVTLLPDTVCQHSGSWQH